MEEGASYIKDTTDFRDEMKILFSPKSCINI